MHGLEVPHAFSGGRVEAHEAFREQVVAGTMSAVIVVGRRAERQIDVAELIVNGEHRPDVGRAGVVGGAVVPGVVPELARLRDGVERPELLAGARIEAEDVAARLLLHERDVVNVRPGDDDVLDDHRRRVDGVVLHALGVGQTLDDVHVAVVPERRIGFAGFSVDRHQVRVVGAANQPPLRAVGPVGNAAMRVSEVGRTAGLPDFRVVLPERAAADGIERRVHAKRRRRVEHAVGHDRRVLETARPRGRIGLDDLVVGRAPAPRHLQVLDVGRRDLRERRILGARGVAAVIPPLTRRCGTLRVNRDNQQRRGERRQHRSGHGRSSLFRALRCCR